MVFNIYSAGFNSTGTSGVDSGVVSTGTFVFSSSMFLLLG